MREIELITYPAMNKEIVRILRTTPESVYALYAAQLIEEQAEQIERLQSQLERAELLGKKATDALDIMKAHEIWGNEDLVAELEKQPACAPIEICEWKNDEYMEQKMYRTKCGHKYLRYKGFMKYCPFCRRVIDYKSEEE